MNTTTPTMNTNYILNEKILYVFWNVIILIPFLKLGFNNTYIEFVELVIITYLCIYLLFKFKSIEIKNLFVMYLLLLLLGINLLYTQFELKDAFNEIRQIVLPFLFYYCVICSHKYTEKYILPKLALIVCYVMGALQFFVPQIVKGYYTTFSNPDIVKTNFIAFSPYNRITGIYEDPNVFGYFMVLILAIRITKSKNNINFKGSLFIFLDYSFILLTQSRWCITIGTLLIILYFLQTNLLAKVKVFIMGISVSIFVLAIYPDFIDTIVTRFNKNTSSTGFSDPRFDNWKHYISVLGKSFKSVIAGKGLGATGMGTDKIIMENDYLDIIYKLGLFGAMVYYLNLSKLFIFKYKYRLQLLPLIAFGLSSIMADIHRIPSITIILFSYYAISKNQK
ncbi:hypothetical protein [Bacillus toyonensis]|uniref:hypothetical protein n=1 Tax=Bacillus toyonensis TaxID=155322 RepID=UPI002E1AEC63|nr:hypothetical protein [Bacillus toyonensis]